MPILPRSVENTRWLSLLIAVGSLAYIIVGAFTIARNLISGEATYRTGIRGSTRETVTILEDPEKFRTANLSIFYPMLAALPAGLVSLYFFRRLNS